MSHGRADVRGNVSWELDYRMRGRIALRRDDVRCTVRVDFVMGAHPGSCTHESDGGGRADGG